MSIFSKSAIAIALSATIGISIVNAAGTGSTPKGKPFVAINGEIVEVKGAISSLQNQIDLLVGHVDSIEQRLTANEGAISTLQNQNAALDALVQQNLSDITSIEAEILILQEANADLEDMIAANTGDIATLQPEVAANDAMIATLQSAILMVGTDIISLETSLQSQINYNTTLIGAIQGEIEELTVEVSMKQNVINGSCPNGNSIREILLDGSVICEFDDFGGGTGGTTYLDAYRTFKSQWIPAGTSATITAFCGDGYIPISVGHHAYDMEVIDKISEPFPGSWGRNIIRNTSSLERLGYTYVNCLRQN